MNTLQTALEAIELLTTDNASEQAQAAAADARIKLMNEMTHVPEADFGNISEPVAWMRTDNHGGGVLSHSLHSEKPKNPPFPALAWITPLYLHPPQQAKQVPMTDNEIAMIAQLTQSAEPGNDGYILPFTFARAIEAHHGIGGEA